MVMVSYGELVEGKEGGVLQTAGVAMAYNFRGVDTTVMRLTFYRIPDKAAQNKW